MSDDRFDLEKEHTAAYRQMLEALRDDVRVAVGEELDDREVPLEELRSMVRSMVRDAVQKAQRENVWMPAVRSALLATVFVSLLGWGVWGLRSGLAGTPEAQADEGVVEVAVDSQPEASTAAHWVHFYDSLLLVRDSSLVAMVPADTLRPSGSATVQEWAVSAPSEVWSPADSTVHTLLVQTALKARADSTLVVDGLFTRGPPCQGATCGALLTYWRVRQGGEGYPGMGPEPESDLSALSVVERLLILDHGGLR